jgi:RNA polymerase sigma-70 factor (ECF subfamily)
VDLEGEGALQVSDFRHPGLSLENQELAGTLMAAIDQLPENQKVAFTLHKISDLNHQEIGEVMGISQSAIESLIHRAKQNLRKLLADYYQNHFS